MSNLKQHYPAATMTPPETPTDPGEAYELVRGLIFDQVNKFQNRYGGDIDDLVGEAHLAFVQGHQEFITGKTLTGRDIKAPFATSIRRWVWYELFDAMRTRVRRSKIVQMTPIEEGQDFEAPAPGFKVAALAEGLSEDARYVMSLVLDPPPQIEKTAEAKGGEPRNYRSTVKQFLTAEKWRSARIDAAFDEVKKALG